MAGYLAGFLHLPEEKLANRKSYTDKQACYQIQNRIIEETSTKPVAGQSLVPLCDDHECTNSRILLSFV